MYIHCCAHPPHPAKLYSCFSQRTARARVLAMLILDPQEKGLCQIRKERDSLDISRRYRLLTWNYLTQEYSTKLINELSQGLNLYSRFFYLLGITSEDSTFLQTSRNYSQLLAPDIVRVSKYLMRPTRSLVETKSQKGSSASSALLPAVRHHLEQCLTH